MKTETRDKLRTVSTPTVATALFKHGYRIGRDRRARLPRLSPPAERADQPHPAPCDRHQRADRLCVHAGSGIFGLYPATDPQSLTDFAEWRKKNGR